VVEVIKSDQFQKWYRRLRDIRARARIDVRVFRLSLGNSGDAKPVGSGVSEMRIDYGPGHRIYFTRHGEDIVILLLGGDKTTQQEDIALAIEIARQWKD
jgi:putative addiction module killer protein